MASSRVMASSSSANSEITRQSSLYSLKSLGSMNIDDLFRNIDSTSSASVALPLKDELPIDGIDDVSAGGGGDDDGVMTLEDFLARAGAVTEEEVGAAAGFGSACLADPDPIGRGRGRGRGRGEKRDAMDPVDRAVLQRQKRMIKNRESAARSRERKQAYTVELESLVMQLEEENAQLRSYREEQTKKRRKQLLESVIPATEQRKPRRPLQRSRSMSW